MLECSSVLATNSLTWWKIQNLRQHITPLTNKPKVLVWNETMSKVFIATKKALADAILLAHPHHGVPLSLTTDASDLAVGAVLQQHTNSF